MGHSEAGVLEDVKEEHRKDSGLTQEEIESLTVDENLNDLQRTRLFFSTNSRQVQQSCAFEKLPKIFHEYGSAACDAFFPALSVSIQHFSPHIQALAGKAFTAIMLQDLDFSKEIAMWLLPIALQIINSIQINDVLQGWIEVLCVLVPKLPLKIVKDDLLQLALARGNVEETTISRVICSRMLGAIAPMLEPQEIEKFFLSKAMALCQDTDAEVRISMCNQLNAVSHAVGIETTKKTVLPELYELLRDEEIEVHDAALKSLVQMLDFLPSDVKYLKILPLLKLICSQKDAKKLIPISRLFGEVMFKMSLDLSEEDSQTFIDCYKLLSRHSSDDLRQLCAYNFPAVLKSIGPRKYAMTLHLTYQQFIQDSSPLVRCSIAASFHEVLKILGKERAATYLKEAFLSLLTDNSREVQKKIFSILHHIIGQFAVANEQQRSTIYASILPYLLQAEKEAINFNMWRLQTSIFETFALLVDYLTSDQIFENLIPLCFHHMMESVLPVRSAAAVTLAKLIRNNHRAVQRYELSQRVVREFGHGRSYGARLVYIDFCEKFLSISSSHMFKEHFLETAISLLQDEVVDVRMRACALLPQLKTVVKLPEDAGSLERINFCAAQRLNDNDKQVAAAARSISDYFKHISVRCIGVEPGNDNYILQMEFETMDKQREEEEWNMLSKDEQEEQRKLDEMIQKLSLETSKKAMMSAATSSGVLEKSTTFLPSRHPITTKFKSAMASLNQQGQSSLSHTSSVQSRGGGLSGNASSTISLSRTPTLLRTVTAKGNTSQQQGAVTASSVMRTASSASSGSTSSSSSTKGDFNDASQSPHKASSKSNVRNNRRS